MSENVETAELLMESIEIRRVITADGGELIRFASTDSAGEPLGLVEAMNLLEFSKIQLTAEMVRGLIFEDDEDEYEDED